MSGFSSLWGDTENMFELEDKLLCSNYALESTRKETPEEKAMYKDNIKHLIDLLNQAWKERDEARDQLHKSIAKNRELQELLNKILSSYSAITSPTASCFEPVASDYLSGTYNNNSNSSSVDCSSNGISTPGFSSANASNSSNFGLKQQPFASHWFTQRGSMPLNNNTIDGASAVIDELAKRKALPEKGKLLQAVMDAGLLMETFLDPVPLPKWRNPPPLSTLRIPWGLVIDGDRGSLNQRVTLNSNFTSPNSLQQNSALSRNSFLNRGLTSLSGINPWLTQ